jgi:hypothetical protein
MILCKCDGFTEEDVLAAKQMLESAGWKVFQKWASKLRAHMAEACLIPHCTTETHKALQAQASFLHMMQEEWPASVNAQFDSVAKTDT